MDLHDVPFDWFVTEVKEVFGYLTSDFGFKLASTEDTVEWSVVRFKSDKTTALVVYEYDQYLTAYLHKPADGDLTCLETSEFSRQKFPALYNVVTLAQYRGRGVEPELGLVPFSKDRVSSALRQLADWLRRYGDDLLRGDFCVLSEIDAFLNARRESATE